MKKNNPDYVTTYTYRGISVDVCADDCGQCYYAEMFGHIENFGSFNPDYKGCIEYIIDEKLDTIKNLSTIDKKYRGGVVKYKDHDHKTIVLVYRLEETLEWDASKVSEKEAIKQATKALDWLFTTPEFKKYEEERIARGDLYIDELIARETEKKKKDLNKKAV